MVVNDSFMPRHPSDSYKRKAAIRLYVEDVLKIAIAVFLMFHFLQQVGLR
jgi:hypothetical protein